MNTTAPVSRLGLAALLLLGIAALGCDREQTDSRDKDGKEGPAAETKKVPLGKNVYLEVQGDQRRVLVSATVCLREGQLEQLLCRKRSKEHESVLVADIDARNLHKALLIAGAKPGSPVQFQPKFKPASGQKIRVTLQYEQKGKVVRVPAQQWVRHLRTKKDLGYDWVFAGSELIPDPDDKNKPPIFTANEGDIICVSNFQSALLDLPVLSTKDNADLVFEAHTERIPPLETPVVIILEPIPDPDKR